MGVFESDLDIYLTNSACVGLRMLGFRLEHGNVSTNSDVVCDVICEQPVKLNCIH